MQRDSYSSSKSMSFALGDGPANALSLSKDNTRVVVAGRHGMIDEDLLKKQLYYLSLISDDIAINSLAYIKLCE
jgi:hypothetical protein